MPAAKKIIIIIALLSLVTTIYFSNIMPVLSWGPSANYENVSVRTTVNVTQAYPEILNITCNSDTDITLTPGSTKAVNCIIEIRDFNGGNTINYANGTFYYSQNESSDPNDNNVHYTNTSCTENATNGYYTNWSCMFDVYYYANNGTWIAHMTVNDSNGFTATDTDNATISTLYALNVTSLIDYGDMAVGDTTTTPPSANVTNFGNMDINVSVYGFGGEDEVTGTGFAMICEQRNLSIHNERYDLSSATAYASMTSLTSSSVTIPDLKIPQQTNDSQQEINSTYWRLHVNVTDNPFGICNGTVVFEAVVP